MFHQHGSCGLSSYINANYISLPLELFCRGPDPCALVLPTPNTPNRAEMAPGIPRVPGRYYVVTFVFIRSYSFIPTEDAKATSSEGVRLNTHSLSEPYDEG